MRYRIDLELDGYQYDRTLEAAGRSELTGKLKEYLDTFALDVYRVMVLTVRATEPESRCTACGQEHRQCGRGLTPVVKLGPRCRVCSEWHHTCAVGPVVQPFGQERGR